MLKVIFLFSFKVSHDRWFLSRLTTHVLSFDGEGNADFFEGSFDEFVKEYGIKGERKAKQNLKLGVGGV